MRSQLLTWKTLEEELPREGIDVLLRGAKDRHEIGPRFGSVFYTGRDLITPFTEVIEWAYLEIE